jgi:LmbE family N-acetylglucosaminyl deacetylase
VGEHAPGVRRGEPHQIKGLWLTNAVEPDHLVDITATIDTKIQALRCHESQVSERVEEFIRVRGKQAGEAAGLAYAEGFKAFSFT